MFLLICWWGFIKKNPFSLSLHQWQDNIINAEKFIFDIDSIDNLIIGSSLAARLQMDSLPNFHNLSLGGQSIFDGLNILKNRNRLPKNVFIETNVILRGENANFKKIVSSPILNLLKANSPIFRSDKQPLVLFKKKVIYKLKGVLEFQENDRTLVTKTDNPIFGEMLALQIEDYSKKIDTIVMNEQFENLKNHVEFLEAKGINVFFFEMPVNHQLVELTKAKYLRYRVNNEFSNNDFITLPKNIKKYKTRDGLHLTSEESKTYTDYFKNEAITVASILYD
jgi:hypothetical protein